MSTLVEPMPVEATVSTESPNLAVTVIEPKTGWRLVDLGELWRYRELLYFLVWRDVKVRYKQTVLGAAWAVLQPLATMIVFTLVLGRVAASPDAAVPYPLFVFAGLLPWMFFSSAVSSAGNSLVANQNLVTKVYFPRLSIPISSIGTSAVDFIVAFSMLVVLMLGYHTLPGWGLLAVPALLLGLAVAALGIGTLLAALTVTYRDFRHVLPFLIQLWMFATPAIYLQSDNVGETTRLLALANPAQGFIANFRAAVLGGPMDFLSLTTSTVGAVGFLAIGALYFRRVERDLADVI